MPNTSRRRRGDQFWRDTVAAWQESGQSVTAFCAAHGIGESTFFGKRRQLARPDRPPNAPAAPTPAPAFTAVRVMPDPTVEIVLPGGVILRVPAGADVTTVARLVLALRGELC